MCPSRKLSPLQDLHRQELMAFLSDYYNYSVQKADSQSLWETAKATGHLPSKICCLWSRVVLLRLWLERLASPSSLPGHVARDHLLGIKHLGRPIWVLGFGSVAPQTPASPAGGPGDRQSCFLLETLVMGLLGS